MLTFLLVNAALDLLEFVKRFFGCNQYLRGVLNGEIVIHAHFIHQWISWELSWWLSRKLALLSQERAAMASDSLWFRTSSPDNTCVLMVVRQLG